MRPDLRLVSLYFGLVIALSAPILALSLAINVEILPGLPIAALAIVCPTLAAAIISQRHGGRGDLRRLLARSVDFRKAGWRLLPVALINPVLFGLAFLASRAFGTHLPDPHVTVLRTLGFAALLLPAALLEEIGWSGFALDHLQALFNPLAASLILGLFWAAWHVPALIQIGRPADWIAWWSLWTVADRIIMVWLYNRTGASVFAVALYHAMLNLCWQLYPVNGSYFDPKLGGLLACALALVLLLWPGPRPKAGRPAA
jgi:uncharacterized protein